MAQQVTIVINEIDVLLRFRQATFKQGEAMEQPKAEKFVSTLKADNERGSDVGLMHDSYFHWLLESINQVREYMVNPPVFGKDDTNINLLMPGNWEHYAPNAPGLKYAMIELISNGLLADWYDNIKQDLSRAFKQKVEVNKAEIHSIIYSLKAPTVTVTSASGSFQN